MSCFIKVYEVIQHEAIAWRLLHCEMIIGCTVSFALGMTALQRFLTTWEENYMPGKKSIFPLYLMQLFFPVRDLRGNFDTHLSLVLFIPLILIKHCWSTVSEKKHSPVTGALKSPPCALSHWPSLCSIHHLTNGNAHRKARLYSLLWIPLDVWTHNRVFFNSLALPL